MVPWYQRRLVWLAPLLLAYVAGGLIWDGITFIPCPQFLYYAPSGLLEMAGMDMSLVPTPKAEALDEFLIIVHAVLWPCLLFIAIALRKMYPKVSQTLYWAFLTLVLVNIAGCFRMAGHGLNR